MNRSTTVGYRSLLAEIVERESANHSGMGVLSQVCHSGGKRPTSGSGKPPDLAGLSVSVASAYIAVGKQCPIRANNGRLERTPNM